MPTFTLRADRVVRGEGDTLRVEPATLRIESGIITAVTEPGAELDTTVDFDLGDSVVAPAFINAHTHLAMIGFRGLVSHTNMRGNVVEDLFFRLESHLTGDDVRAWSRLAAYDCLAAGTGTVWDHYYFATSVAEGLRDAGLAGVVAPTLQDLSGPGRGQLESQLDATLALDSTRWRESGIYSAVGPHAVDTVSAPLWARVHELASTRRLPIHTHIAQSLDEYRRIHDQQGCSPLAWLERLGVLDRARMLAVHAIFAADDDLARLRRSRHFLAHCPTSAQQFCFPAYLPSWHRAGVPWCLGTDSPASNDTNNVQQELRSVAGTRAHGVSMGARYARFRAAPSEAHAQAVDDERVSAFDQLASLSEPRTLLPSVWSVPGRLHPAFMTGAIKVGARADLAMYDPQHPALWPLHDTLRALIYCNTSAALVGLMLAGSWRIRPGMRAEFESSAELAEARDEARMRLNALLARARVPSV